jgi:atypical protein kinase C zeta type
LLDRRDHLKLVDFDFVEKIGTESRRSPPPWARLLGQEASSQKGTWGINGPQTEQFAIGSIIYIMTRGH